jgi:hypothetical protein
VARSLQGIPGITATPMCFTLDERLVPEPVNCVVIRFDAASRHTAASVSEKLRAGRPSVAATVMDGALVPAFDALLDGHEKIVAESLLQILRS